MTQEKNDFTNAKLKRFNHRLADVVQLLHGSRCPCCRYPMMKPRKKSLQNHQRRDRITVAHDVPVAYGGSASVWVYACQGCNADQKTATFRAWSAQLARQQDRRAPFVAELADVIDRFQEKEKHDKLSAVPADTDAVRLAV